MQDKVAAAGDGFEVGSAEQIGGRVSYRLANLMLVLLLLAYLVSFIDRQILSLLIGPIRADFRISDLQFSLLQGASFAIFYASLGIPLGWLADRSRRTAIAGTGAIIWSLSTIACGLVSGFGGLFSARIMVGAGEAALSPSAYSLLADAFPAHRLARAMGIFVLGIPLGAGIGFIVGGAVVEVVNHAQTTIWPVVGEVHPWQLVFMLVGLPGIVLGLALALLEEPERKTSLGDSAGEHPVPFVDVLRYLWIERRRFVPIFLSIQLLSISGNAMLGWYPAYLGRAFGLSIGTIGVIIGLLYLVFGTVGAVGAPLVAEFFVRRGRRDANLRTVMWVGLILSISAAISPFMPGLPWVLVAAAPAVVMLNAGYGLTSAELQLVSPNRMRGTLAALLILSNNLVGLAFGMTAVPLLNRALFHDDGMIGYSIAITIAFSAGLAAWCAARGLSVVGADASEGQAPLIPQLEIT